MIILDGREIIIKNLMESKEFNMMYGFKEGVHTSCSNFFNFVEKPV